MFDIRVTKQIQDPNLAGTLVTISAQSSMHIWAPIRYCRATHGVTVDEGVRGGYDGVELQGRRKTWQ